MKNILILGNGGREYSMALELRKDSRVGDIFFSPQSGGATKFLSAKSFSYSSKEILLEEIRKNNIEFVVVGPEAPLIDGIVDFLMANKIACFGANAKNARLEGSKAYMKEFVSRLGIPSARYLEVSESNKQEGFDFIDSFSDKIVLKASGICAGKGVIITDDKGEAKRILENMLSGNLFGDSGKCVVIEEFLEGYELSLFAISNGNSYTLFPACQDHKRLLDGDNGPNTGGMGAYNVSLPKLYNKQLESKIREKILNPTFNALKNEGNPYIGVLFAGIMVVKDEPYLLEYNVRFGDPECQVLMPLLDTPLLDIVECCARGEEIEISLRDECAVCVVIASSDYALETKSPNYPAKITLQDFSAKGHLVFANASMIDGELYANSGRVAAAVGIGANMKEARDNAYEICKSIEFEGSRYRKDIGHQSL